MGEAIESRGTSRVPWIGFGLLGILVLAVFSPAMNSQFVTWDDEPLIYANPNIAHPTAATLGWHWRHAHDGLYIPVVYTGWWCIARLELALSGPAPMPSPAAFHFANLCVHLMAIAVVFWLLRRIVKRPWAALAGTAFFALHPIQVESVAWATGMKDLLGGLFMLGAVAAYMSAAEREPSRGRWWMATIIFIIALLAKPSTVATPLIAMALDYFTLRRPLRTAVLWLWPWFALAGGWALLTRHFQPALDVNAGSWWTRPWIAADAIGFYLEKIAWPVHLGLDYGRTPERVIMGHDILGAAIALVIALVVWRMKKPKLTAAALVFAAGLLPVLGFVPFDFQAKSTVADRYVYAAMLGPAIAVALAASALPRRLAAFLFGVAIAGWAVLSFIQVQVWHDSASLYSHALVVNPQSLTAAQDLAVVYDKSGNELQAIECYLRAIAIAPNEREEYDNLALALPRAERQFPQTPERWAQMHDQLAMFYKSHGEMEEARQQQLAARGLR